MSSDQSIEISALVALLSRALGAAGAGADIAGLVARALVKAEIDGQTGHGLSRVASYAAQLRSGKVDGHAVPRVDHRRSGAIVVDAEHGFAYPALALAIERLPGMAAQTGIAVAAVTRSHHCGVAGHHVEALAERGLVALMAANTPSAMAPWGGRRALLGTNPIAFAAPIPQQPPLVIDLALTEVARGRIVATARAGMPIPPGWAVDRDGRPTTDPKEALAGTLLPAGGAKGAALALMVEVLTAGLAGGALAFEASSFLDAEGPPPSTGQILIAIDPDALGGSALLGARMTALAHAFALDGARLPGSRRLEARARVERDGLAVDAKLLAELRTLAGEA